MNFPKRVSAFFSVLLCSLFFIAHLTSIPVVASPNSVSRLGADANPQSVAEAINQQRAYAGLPALALHPLISQAAQNHVNDMISRGYYNHTGSDGSNVTQRVLRTGYPLDGWASENWVAVTDPAGAIRWWMNSPVHRNNILNGNWREFGVGGAVDSSNGMAIFVAVFATGNDGSAPAPPVAVSAPQVTRSTAGGGYTIQPGDTLGGVAARHGMSWQELARANSLGEFSILQIGQTITIPGSSGYSGGYSTGGGNNLQSYTVQDGDSLFGIANRLGISWQELADLNRLTANSVLQIGQVLHAPANATGNVPQFHTIQPGDTILAIAINYGLDWHTVLSLNGLGESSLLQLGQQIRLR